MPEGGDVKVDEQTQLQSHEFQVGDDLGIVDRQKSFDCFDFDEQLAVDHQIDSIPAVQGQAFVV